MPEILNGGSLERDVSPCPRCHSKNVALQSTSLGYTAWWVVCADCGHEGPARFDRKDALAYWKAEARAGEPRS